MKLQINYECEESPWFYPASNSASIRATSSEQIPFILEKPPYSSYIGCQLGKHVALNNHHGIQCKCHNTFKGGIDRLKRHIVNMKGDVRSCPNYSDEEKNLCRQNLEATAKIIRSEKKSDYKFCGANFKWTRIWRTWSNSYYLHALGPIDRTIDFKKSKQSTLNKGKRTKWKEIY